MISKGEKGPHKIQGIGAGFLPNTLDTDIIDDVVTIDNDASGDARQTHRDNHTKLCRTLSQHAPLCR